MSSFLFKKKIAMSVIIGIAIFLDFLMIRTVGFSIFARCGIIIFAERSFANYNNYSSAARKRQQRV